MSLKENSEETLSSTTTTVQNFLNYRPFELDLSDDGSVASEPDHEHSSKARRSSTGKQRRSSTASQLSPSISSSLQLGGPLPSYPVSLRKQIAIIKQMEQPITASDSSSSNSSLHRTDSCSSSAATKLRRVPRIYKKNERGETALHVAARRGEYKQCKKLLQDGAMINAKDYAGWTPLHEACSRANFKVAKLLISSGADVNALSDSADTPLHDAASSGSDKLVWLLLRSGACRNCLNNSGKRPVDLCSVQCVAIRSLLESSVIPESYSATEDSIQLSPRSQISEAQHCSIASCSRDIESSNYSEARSLAVPANDEVHSFSSVEISPIKASDKTVSMDENSSPSMSSAVDSSSIASSAAIFKKEVEPSKSDNGGADLTKSESGNETLITAADQAKCSGEAALSENDFALDFDDLSLDLPFSNRDTFDAETRRIGRPRGFLRRDHYSAQQKHQKSAVGAGEKRKPRGRRRGRGGNVQTSGVNFSSTYQPNVEDVYEFRSSPESDINLNKINTDMDQEMADSPSLPKRRCVGLPDNETSQQQKEEDSTNLDSEFGKNEGCVSNEQIDGKNESPTGRKVPPLRISLPRTPSEDSQAATLTDEGPSSVAGSGRRNGRINKGQIKKYNNEELVGKDTEGIQRITRSKFRQKSRQVREMYGSYEDVSKRKNISWRKLQPPTPNIDDNSTNDDPVTIGQSEINDMNEAEMEGQTEATSTDESVTVPLILMQKNAYDGYRSLRSLIEQRWIDAMSVPSASPELPKNYDKYMIAQSNIEEAVVQGAPNSEENEIINRLTGKLRDLRSAQLVARQDLEEYHKVERERLQMQAEGEIIKMRTRRANIGHEPLTVVQMLCESSIYNPWYLDTKREPPAILEDSAVQEKFQKLADLMQKRQRMESMALHSEQLHAWNAAIDRHGDSSHISLKNNIPQVEVIPLQLNL